MELSAILAIKDVLADCEKGAIMVIKPTREDAMRAVLDSETKLLVELERSILEAEAMDSSVQHTLKRVRGEVAAIYAPLRKHFEDMLE